MNARAAGAPAPVPGLALALGLALAGCRQTLDLPPSVRGPGEEPAGQMDLQREYWDPGPAPKNLRSEVEGLVYPGGRFVKHGRERSFYRGGRPEFVRHWVRGEPAGTWRSWWGNGRLRSECEFPRDASPSEMAFWHESGVLAGRGPAILGRRTGPWQFFRDDGSLEAEGLLVDGLCEGEWRFLDECGVLVETIRYARGVKQ